MCIHGLYQSSIILSRKLLEILTYFKHNYIVNPIIPNGHLNFGIDEETGQEKRGWYEKIDYKCNSNSYNDKIKKEDCSLNNESKFVYEKFEEGIQRILEEVKDNKDINCIFGFSQGGVLANVIAMMIETDNKIASFFPNLKCLILCSSDIKTDKSISPSIDKIIEDFINKKHTINIPSLHVYGDKDEVISSENTIKQSYVYKNPELYNHGGKHYIGKRSVNKLAYTNFLKKYIK